MKKKNFKENHTSLPTVKGTVACDFRKSCATVPLPVEKVKISKKNRKLYKQLKEL
jgi:hypothetical protein